MTYNVEMCMVPKCSKSDSQCPNVKNLRFRWSSAIPVPGNTALLVVPFALSFFFSETDMLKWNHCAQVTNESHGGLNGSVLWNCSVMENDFAKYTDEMKRPVFLSFFPWKFRKALRTQRKRVPQSMEKLLALLLAAGCGSAVLALLRRQVFGGSELKL